jgi:hypothetical protein
MKTEQKIKFFNMPAEAESLVRAASGKGVLSFKARRQVETEEPEEIEAPRAKVPECDVYTIPGIHSIAMSKERFLGIWENCDKLRTR